MFCRAGEILDPFIPIEKHSGRKGGLAFIRFGSFQEAERAVEMACGRSWGGRFKRCPDSKKEKTSDQMNVGQNREGAAQMHLMLRASQTLPTVMKPAWRASTNAFQKKSGIKSKGGWIVMDGLVPEVRLPSHVIKE